MANFGIHGVGELEELFKDISTVPVGVKEEILREMANVTAEAQKKEARAMGVYDPESRVHIADKVKVNKPKINADGGSITVTFSGTRRRGNTTTRNAEIAFINEFGKRGVPAKPFISTANQKNADRINEAGASVYNKWLGRKTGG